MCDIARQVSAAWLREQRRVLNGALAAIDVELRTLGEVDHVSGDSHDSPQHKRQRVAPSGDDAQNKSGARALEMAGAIREQDVGITVFRSSLGSSHAPSAVFQSRWADFHVREISARDGKMPLALTSLALPDESIATNSSTSPPSS